MPLYEYRCEQCGRFETLQKFSDAPLSVCPTCGGAVERLISAPAFQFKGSGWYVTDYARAGEAKGSDSKESGAKAADSKSEKSAGSSKEKETTSPTSADSKSSTNSPPKESTASAAPALAPAATPSQ